MRYDGGKVISIKPILMMTFQSKFKFIFEAGKNFLSQFSTRHFCWFSSFQQLISANDIDVHIIKSQHNKYA